MKDDAAEARAYTGPTRKLRSTNSNAFAEWVRQGRLAMTPYVQGMAGSQEKHAEALQLAKEQRQRSQRDTWASLALLGLLLIFLGALVKVLIVLGLIFAGWDRPTAELIGTVWTIIPAVYLAQRVWRSSGL